MGSQWLRCMSTAEHVALRTSTDGVLCIPVDIWPRHGGTCKSLAFFYPQMNFVNAKQNVLLHSDGNDNTTVVQNLIILLIEIIGQSTILTQVTGQLGVILWKSVVQILNAGV